MNNKRIVYLIILIATVLIAVLGATYAYFESATSVDDASFTANVVTANSSIFSAYSEGNIEFNLTSDIMTQANVSTNIIATDNATIVLSADSGNANTTMACTYDLVWVWDSIDKYTESDATLPYYSLNKEGVLRLAQMDGFTGTTYEEFLNEFCSSIGPNCEDVLLEQALQMQEYSPIFADMIDTYEYELSVSINGSEYDLSSLDWQADNTALISKKTIYSVNGEAKNLSLNVSVNAYNIPVNQANLFNKNLKAHIEVRNSTCASVPNSLADICKVGDNYSDCTQKMYTVNGGNGLYLHDEDYILGTNDGSLRYAGLEYDTYNWSSLLKSENIKTMDMSIFGSSYKNTYYFESDTETKEKVERVQDLYNKAIYGLTEEENVFVNTFIKDYENGDLRLYTRHEMAYNLVKQGKMTRVLKNYVCFEGDDCTNEDNLYRVMGIFNSQAKLVKFKPLAEMKAWNASNTSNEWEGSTLEQYLNNDYLNSLGNKADLIANHDWQVGGVNYRQLVSNKTKK